MVVDKLEILCYCMNANCGAKKRVCDFLLLDVRTDVVKKKNLLHRDVSLVCLLTSL